MGYPSMKRLLAISALALIATACGTKESRMILLECSEDKKDTPPTIEQIKKATAEDPDRVKKILLSGADGSESYKEDYGEKNPHYPFIWVIDKQLGIDYEYSNFEEAMVPYQDPPPEKEGAYDTYYTSARTRLSDDKKIFISEYKTWRKNVLLGEYDHSTVIEKINLETLKMEFTPDDDDKTYQQCVEHKMPESIKVNFPKSN